jgi:hypothetical protein
MWLKGFAADEMSAAYARAGELPDRGMTLQHISSATTRSA